MPQLIAVDLAAVEPVGDGAVRGDVDGDPVRGDQLDLGGPQSGADPGGDDAPGVAGEQQGAEYLSDPIVEWHAGCG